MSGSNGITQAELDAFKNDPERMKQFLAGVVANGGRSEGAKPAPRKLKTAPPPDPPIQPTSIRRTRSESRPLAGILDDVCAYETSYIAIDEHGAVVVTLWATLTHVYDAFDVSPY